MQSPDVLKVAATLVPGRGEPEIRKIEAGAVNATYRVVRDGLAYALRTRVGAAPAPGADPVWECRVAQWAAAAQFAPMLVHCDPAQGVQITRWVDGRAPAAPHLRGPAGIAQVAALIARIHAEPAPVPARSADAAAWIAHYRQLLDGYRVDGLLSSAGAASSGPTPAELALAAGKKLAALEQLPKAAPVLCHGDLHTGNLIETERGLTVVDWEYAHVSDPLWDLAGWSSANDFDGGLRRTLLECYCGRTPTQDEQARLRLLAWLFDCMCVLWSKVYLARYPDHPEPGIAARAQLLSARL
jgi:aminoglycoside phosphotransferase (APT) family kinase protein